MSNGAFPLLGYAVEKYGSAVRTLATFPGDVRSRLRNSLEVLLISTEMVPNHENVHADIAFIHTQLARFGDISTTLRRIHNVTGSRIAERVCSAYFKLERAQALELARLGVSMPY